MREFCYLGDMLGDGGGCEAASRTRVKCAWSKFRELAPFLTSRGVSLNLKRKIYRCCVQNVMVYGSETWATRVVDVQRLERNEMMMVRWMCGVSLKDRKSNQELLDRLGIASVAEIVRRGRLRWFGHIERKSQDDWVSKCRDLAVDGVRGRGRGRKTWNGCVEEDMRKLGLKRVDAQDRTVWRSAILGKTSDPRKRGNRT